MRKVSFFIDHRVNFFKNISIEVCGFKLHVSEFFWFAGVIIEFGRSCGSFLMFDFRYVGSISKRIVFDFFKEWVWIVIYWIEGLIFFIFSCYMLLLCLGESVNFIAQGVNRAFFHFLNSREVIVLKFLIFTLDAIVSQVWRLKNFNARFINLVFVSRTYNNFGFQRLIK